VPSRGTSSGIGDVPRTVQPARLSRRHRILILTCLAIVAALAWTYLVVLERRMSASSSADAAMVAMGMVATRWTIADVLFTFLMWTVMMVGMMAGAAAPVLLLFAETRAERTARGVPLSVLIFGLGYAAVWTAFSAAATLVQWGLHETALLSAAMSTSSPRLAGSLLIAAGAYQLTPLKFTCLTHCRHPLGFLMTNWREGSLGALRMGIGHGSHCLGCCWALMCVLFVAGVMNLAWAAALSVFVLVEKIGPGGAAVARVAGTALILVGVLFLARTV
jgi:predicted metal-binding membrane protein